MTEIETQEAKLRPPDYRPDGNIGGSLGFAHLASYMCPGQIAIGHSLTPKRLRNGYDSAALPQEPMPRTPHAGYLSVVGGCSNGELTESPIPCHCESGRCEESLCGSWWRPGKCGPPLGSHCYSTAFWQWLKVVLVSGHALLYADSGLGRLLRIPLALLLHTTLRK
jgi:hypothetical protein